MIIVIDAIDFAFHLRQKSKLFTTSIILDKLCKREDNSRMDNFNNIWF